MQPLAVSTTGISPYIELVTLMLESNENNSISNAIENCKSVMSYCMAKSTHPTV